jgi:hypothetical protein
VRKQLFNCRGCGGRGDVIDLLRLVTGSTYVEAKAAKHDGQAHDHAAT